MAKKTESLEIESALKKLDEILKQLESDDLALSKSLELYEEGVRISDSCKSILEAAEQKIQTLNERASSGK